MSVSLPSIKPTRSPGCLRPPGVKYLDSNFTLLSMGGVRVYSSGGIMIRDKSLRYALLLAFGVFLATSGHAQQPQPAPQAAKPAKAAKAPKKAAAPAVEPVLEPKALEILKAA